MMFQMVEYVCSSLNNLTWWTWITPQVVIGGRCGKCVSVREERERIVSHTLRVCLGG